METRVLVHSDRNETTPRGKGITSIQRAARGSYLIESALAVLATSFFVVAVGDISRIFQARGALRAAVTEGLRCLYPTDPACATSSEVGVELSMPRYNAWVWGSRGYLLPQHSYSVVSTMFNEPVWEVPFRASKIDSVDVSQPYDRYEQHAIRFPVVAHAPYLLTVRDLPILDGREPLDPVFRDRRTGARIAPSQTVSIRTLQKTGVDTVPKSSRGEDEYSRAFEIGSRSFTLSEAWPQRAVDARAIGEIHSRYGVVVPCYQGDLESHESSPRIVWPAHGAPAECSYRTSVDLKRPQPLFAHETLKVPIMIRISGISRATRSDAIGKLVVTMSWTAEGKSNTRVLGGRVFSSTNFAHLVVRGADWSDIQPAVHQYYETRYRSEVDLHGTLPLLPIDVPITLRFYLSSVNGEKVGWQGESIEIFHPQFKFIHETFPCGYAPNPNECGSPAARERALFTEVDPLQQLDAFHVGAGVCARDAPGNIEESVKAAILRMEQIIAEGKRYGPHSFWVRSSEACPTVTTAYPCRDSFHQFMKGCQPTHTIADIERACSINDFRPERDSIRIVHQTEKALERVERRGECSQEKFPTCAQPHAAQVGEQYLGSSAASCQAAINISPVSEQHGPLLDSVCVSVSEKLRAHYRETHRIPPDVPISVFSRSEPPLVSAAPPADLCTPSEPIEDGDPRRGLCARGVSRQIAMECCDTHQGRCALEELPETTLSADTRSPELLLDLTANRIADSIRTLYPPARSPSQCRSDSVNCVHVVTSLENDSTSARAEASMRVPLTLLSWLGENATGLVEYRESRRLEQSLVGRGE
jgi:hypothetical protein